MSSPASLPADPHQPPSLDELVACFVAAKRSLAATQHVYRANEIVEDARASVEEAAILEAKNAYLRDAVGDQVHTLNNIHGGLDHVAYEAQHEFQSVVKSLDVANDRLQATLASLRKTLVSTALQYTPAKADDPNDLGVKEPAGHGKTLYDFIDESTHTNLLDSLRATIDSYNEIQATLNNVSTSLAESMQQIKDSLAVIDEPEPAVSAADIAPLTSDHFQSLSANASEMAVLLESLISHYDLCITALKHTEGGGEAARAATNSATEPGTFASGADSPTEASLYDGAGKEASREPISADEKAEMLSVLRTDAEQVNDVVDEIRDRAADMSTTLSALQNATAHARTRFTSLQAVIDTLAELATTTLPSCVLSSVTFRARWADLRGELVDKTSGVADLVAFYESFLASYAGLLREVDRRDMVETKMRKIAERAVKDIAALRAEDDDMRKQFVKEVGEWLPRDIWPGLVQGSARWELRRLDDDVGRGIEGGAVGRSPLLEEPK